MRNSFIRVALCIGFLRLVLPAAAEVDLAFQFFIPSLESCEPANSTFDSFEVITLPILISNTGAAPVSNIVVTLAEEDGVAATQGGILQQNYGSLNPGFFASRDFRFRVDRPNHAVLRLNFHLTDSEGDWGVKTLHRTVGMKGSSIRTLGSTGAIPDSNHAGINITFEVPEVAIPSAPERGLVTSSNTVGDVAIELGDCSGANGITHSYVGDLVLKLTHPDGTVVQLMNRPGPSIGGSSGDNFCSMILDDEGGGGSVQDIPNGINSNPGMWKPLGPLSRLIGRRKSGTWVLNVADVAANDVGSVDNIRLIIHEAPSVHTYSYTNPPVAIPDANAAGVEVALNVTDFPGVIGDLDFSIDGTNCSSDPDNVDVGLNHTYVGDLQMTLISPKGRRVIIYDASAVSGNNLCNFVLDDEIWTHELTDMLSSGVAPYTGRWKPSAALSAFRGEDPNGTWKLLIIDLGFGDQGAIRKFSLRITPNEADRDSLEKDSDVFSSNQSGSMWVPMGHNDPAIVGTDYDATNQAYRVRVFTAPSKYRNAGWLNNRPDWLPYSAVGTGNYVRGKFYVYAQPPPAEAMALTQIPNFKMRLANRFAVTSELTIQSHAAADPGNNPYALELRPSTVVNEPSVYRLDFDPVDVPYLRSGSPEEGIMSGIEIFTLEPQDRGYIGFTQLELGVYPALADARHSPVKEFAATGSDAGNLRIYNSGTDLYRVNYVLPPGGSPQGTYAGNEFVNLPTHSESAAGITLDTTSVPTDRIGFIERHFYAGHADGAAGHSQRPRCEENKLYKIRFHVTSTRPSSAQGWLMMRARTIKFAYTQSLILGGSFAAGSLANQAIARETLPGVGSLNPDKNATENGGWYTMLMNTPMDTDIRGEAVLALPLSSLMPNISALPGPGSSTPSNRDIKLGAQVYDTLSQAAGKNSEVANFTIDRIEVRTFGQVED